MQVDVQNTTVHSADGSSIKLGKYSGEVILVVNLHVLKKLPLEDNIV